MSQTFPYTFISCPCSDEARRVTLPNRASREIQPEEDVEDEDKSFDSRDPRSNFSLFPPEHLLYCEECHDIKCPRCITEEIVSFYCPGCLFEVPSSSVKVDDGCCSRNCFSCPICMSQLITTSAGEGSNGPYILSCNYCMWSSLDIGLRFKAPSGLRSQIDKMGIGGVRKKSSRSTDAAAASIKKSAYMYKHGFQEGRAMLEAEQAAKKDKDIPDVDPMAQREPHTQFTALKAFYKQQLAMGDEDRTGPALYKWDSPSAIGRIMNLYNPQGSKLSRTSKPHQTTMREALDPSEGLILQSDIDEKPHPIPEYIDAVSPDQQAAQNPVSMGDPHATHVSQLWPMSMKLRCKRSKRCAACKHILVKPEFKVTSTRYRIKLIATNYMPLITLRPVPVPGGPRPPGPDGADIVLEPGKASQWIMKLTNPLFEKVSVSLGSPSVTPGKHGHKVTILCPQFSIGKNGDVWDDALATSATATKNVTNLDGVSDQIAGKVYESGRNWTSIVVEIIPNAITDEDDTELEEDEDVVEIPIRVRLEWTVADEQTERTQKKSDKALEDGAEVDDGKRELAYWMVVGIGRVATSN